MTGRHHLGLVAAAATLLAAAPMASIYDGWTWLFQCVAVVALTTAAAIGSRSRRAPGWAQSLAALTALTLGLTWLFPSGEELLWTLPSPATLGHFATLIGDAPAAMRAYATPVPDDDALLFVTVLGVGLVAILVDLCAVALERPALTGLPMLAIYSVPVAVNSDSVSAIPFVIGALGYLWLLAADNLERVRRFGRRFTGDGKDVEPWEPSPLATAGRRLTVIGVALAVALPLAMPTTTGLVNRIEGGLSRGSGSGGGTGEVNLFADLYGRLSQDTTEDLVRVTTTDPNPFYLRFAVASDISDAGFAPATPIGPPVTSARLRPVVPQGAYTANVEITERFREPLAPTYSEVTRVSGLDTQWLYDSEQQIVFSDQTLAAGRSYQFDYIRDQFSPAALRNTPMLPGDHPAQRFTEVREVPEVRELVEELTSGADNPYDRMLALYNHFSIRNGFRYSLETGPETTGVAIVDFLDNKLGYCVQYAAALAWMARTAGIPARVAIGFTRGNKVHTNTYILTNRNLHAWTEVYFEGFGWVPFDATPTASIAGGIDPTWAPSPDRPAPDTAPAPAPDPAGQHPDGPDSQPEENGPEFADDGTTGSGAQGAGGFLWPWSALAGVAWLILLLALPALSRTRLRRARLSAAVTAARPRCHAAWDELLDTMVDYQLPLDPTETPRSIVQRLAATGHLVGPAHEGARLLGQAEERARYARAPSPPEGLSAGLQVVRQALASGATRRTRWRAAVIPPSTLARWRSAVAETITSLLGTTSRSSQLFARLSPRRLLRTPRRSRA